MGTPLELINALDSEIGHRSMVGIGGGNTHKNIAKTTSHCEENGEKFSENVFSIIL